MKKVVLLALGLFVAGLAAWAVPREQKSLTLKVEIEKATVDQVVVTHLLEQMDFMEMPLLQERWRHDPSFISVDHRVSPRIEKLRRTPGYSAMYRWRHKMRC